MRSTTSQLLRFFLENGYRQNLLPHQREANRREWSLQKTGRHMDKVAALRFAFDLPALITPTDLDGECVPGRVVSLRNTEDW